MNALSGSELAFVVKSIQSGARLDLRGPDSERDISFRDCDAPQADRSLNCRLGQTEVEINAVFKSTMLTYRALHLLPNASIPAGASRPLEFKLTGDRLSRSPETLCSLFNTLCTFDVSNSTDGDWRTIPIFREFESIINQQRIGISIEAKIINDDGNIIDLVFRGLHEMFSGIRMPNIDDLTSCLTAQFNLPISRTIATISGVVISDPTLLEEASADGLIHIFTRDNEIVQVLTSGSISFSEVKSIISARV